MKIYAETPRLVLRELHPSDAESMFAMDSDPEVHKYVGARPTQTIQDTSHHIDLIRQQYVDNGIGRWAVIEKASGQFIGWSGLKLMRETVNGHTLYYDLGYRLMKKYWGQGYATESAKAALDYSFRQFKPEKIYGMAHTENKGSTNVLTKSGLRFVEEFDFEGTPHNWYRISSVEWRQFV